jgi:hypothetical protein
VLGGGWSAAPCVHSRGGGGDRARRGRRWASTMFILATLSAAARCRPPRAVRHLPKRRTTCPCLGQAGCSRCHFSPAARAIPQSLAVKSSSGRCCECAAVARAPAKWTRQRARRPPGRSRPSGERRTARPGTTRGRAARRGFA